MGEIADDLAALKMVDARGQTFFEFPFEGSADSTGNIFTKSVLPCVFDRQLVGSLDFSILPKHAPDRKACEDLAQRLSPWFLKERTRQVETAHWLSQVFASLSTTQRDWVGVYWKEPQGLVVGPYIGPLTPHTRIEEGKGFCGLAVQQKATVNVDDVTADSRFLACSTSTRSEIVIPIFNRRNEVVGELDIDSNLLSSFDKQTQVRLEEKCKAFGTSLE
ncbi:MAG: GAF domain-containing protein [Bdellovibrionales bacterium]|nr:GAF domain-containing protein [Bdellovibrionales bacterium]